MNLNRLVSNHYTLVLILRLSCFFVFLGRAWQHLVWDAPYRAFFWDENLLSPLITTFTTLTWESYVTHPRVDLAIQFSIRMTGVLYLACAALSLSPKKVIQKLGALLFLGSASLMLLALLYCKEQFLYLGQFVEYAAQFGAPAFLYMIIVRNLDPTKLIKPLKIAVALTFAGHGLYAIGYYPVPGQFVDMTISILGVSEPVALKFLFTAGLLDFAIALAVFCPMHWSSVWSKLAMPTAIYAVFWGFVTALARLIANYDALMPLATLNQWLPEVIFRLPHAGVPAAFVLCSLSCYYQSHVRTESTISSRPSASLTA